MKKHYKVVLITDNGYMTFIEYTNDACMAFKSSINKIDSDTYMGAQISLATDNEIRDNG